MKTMITLILLIGLSAYPQQERCKCKPPKAKANSEEDATQKEYIYKKLYGQAVDQLGNPLENISVEVFSVAEGNSDPSATAQVERRALASCKTDRHGMYCFGDIKRGKYEISLSDHEARAGGPFQDMTLTVTIDRHHPESTDKLIKTYLSLLM